MEETKEISHYKQSGTGLKKTSQVALSILLGASTVYGGASAFKSDFGNYMAKKNQFEAKMVDTKNITDSEIKDLLNQKIEEGVRKNIVEYQNSIKDSFNKFLSFRSQEKEKASSIMDLQNQIKKLVPESTEHQNLIRQSLELEREYLDISNLAEKELLNLQITYKKIETDLGEDIVQSSIIDSEWVDWLNGLDSIKKIGVSILFLNYAIVSALISIIFIFYGDYLIKKYDLENKYPRLNKIILLRKKFNRYYLLISILAIFAVVIIQVIFALYLLF